MARWVEQVAGRHPAFVGGEATIEIVDVADYGLPLLDEPVPPLFGDYRHPHTRRWAATIGVLDAFVFVTAEYNHSIPGALKNSIDFLCAEWSDKPAGLVSYGIHGGTRSADHLRVVLPEVRVVVVPTQVELSVFKDFDFTGSDPTDPTAAGVIAPGEDREPTLTAMLDEVVAWSRALRTIRAAVPRPVDTATR